jgi:hypothetical protein
MRRESRRIRELILFCSMWRLAVSFRRYSPPPRGANENRENPYVRIAVPSPGFELVNSQMQVVSPLEPTSYHCLSSPSHPAEGKSSCFGNVVFRTEYKPVNKIHTSSSIKCNMPWLEVFRSDRNNSLFMINRMRLTISIDSMGKSSFEELAVAHCSIYYPFLKNLEVCFLAQKSPLLNSILGHINPIHKTTQ